MAPLTLGFLMDPLETVRVDHDSTFALMLEAQKRGHRVVYFEQGWLRFNGRVAEARMRHVTVRRELGRHFDVLDEAPRELSTVDVLFLRKDPPVDAEFLHATQLVELCGDRPPVYINDPAGIRDANEKLFSLRYPDLMPDTRITRELPVLLDFIARNAQGTILKPVDGFGGKGILFLAPGDRNARSAVELLTSGGREAVVAQAYIPESRQGDKRIILVDGEPVGGVLRVPSGDDHRGNMAAGGTPHKAVLSARDLEICERLKPELRKRGLLLVGIDVLGDYLTEVNVTSPTGLVEANHLDDVCIEARVLDVAERLAARRPKA
ncbi:glutathione synthase [Myxococcus faecalis]|uniref:glutathione synthase n=1 Tax=Myxococcus TaxID=32 RepID=UPI001CC09C78|nr:MULTISPECIES: glutathione synthase [unclassified Myxococcus]MBZ4399169.1 glutathione synthase [Myxococcus sp. AS-1-15]MBZ4411627.1 glutathione synthase [Myxococcus sp. XM-1-1-1]BDT30348.1 glutathione synthase [Myxococcus sp. MH1]